MEKRWWGGAFLWAEAPFKRANRKASLKRQHWSWDLNNGRHVKKPRKGSWGQRHSKCKGPEADLSWSVRGWRMQRAWGMVREEISGKKWGQMQWNGETHQHQAGLINEQVNSKNHDGTVLTDGGYGSAECEPKVPRSQGPEPREKNGWYWGRVWPWDLASEELSRECVIFLVQSHHNKNLNWWTSIRALRWASVTAPAYSSVLFRK